jgi:hypothetical protein
MTNDITGPGEYFRRRAAAQAAKLAVDAQGKPIDKPSTYTYDAKGLLIKAERAADE